MLAGFVKFQTKLLSNSSPVGLTGCGKPAFFRRGRVQCSAWCPQSLI
jgi:hypothetical protein